MKNEPKIPRFIIVDSIRLTQVLMNFIGNGIKFTSEGRVTVSSNWEPDNKSILPEYRQ